MLQPNTTYFVKARTVSQNGISSDSNVITVVTTDTLTRSNITSTPISPTINKLSILGNFILFDILDNPSTEYHTITISDTSDFSNLIYDQIRFDERIVLDYDTTYYFRLFAVNFLGISNFTQGNFRTDNVLLTPIIRGVHNLSSIGATVYWTPTPNANSYNIDIALDNTFTTIIVSNQSVVQNQFQTSILSENTQYFVRVRAFRMSPLAVSNYSEIISFRTLLASNTQSKLNYTDLNSPTISINYITNTNAILSWNNDYDNYDYELTQSNTTVTTGTISTNSVKLSNLEEGTAYTFRVRGVNRFSQSLFATVNFNTFRTSANILPPILFQFTNVTSSSFRVNWQRRMGISKYVLDIDTSHLFTSPFRYFLNDIDNFTILHLASNTTYHVRLFSISDLTQQISSESNSIAGVTLNSASPISLNPADVQHHRVLLSWAGSPDYFNYQLTIYTRLGNYLGFYNNYDLGNASSHTVHYFLFSNQTYRYRIRGIRTNGDFRDVYGTFQTLALAPELNISNNGIDLYWNGKADNIEISYNEEFIELFNNYPDKLVFDNYHKLPKNVNFVRIYADNGLPSEAINIKGINWVRTNSRTTTSIELEWNNKHSHYHIQVLDENGILLPNYLYPVRINTNTFLVSGLVINTTYQFRIYSDSNEYLPHIEKTLRHDENMLVDVSTLLLNENDVVIKETNRTSIGLELSNRFDYYNVVYSDSPNFVWYEELLEQTEKCLITELRPNTNYFIRVAGITNNNISPKYEIEASTKTSLDFPNIINQTPVLSQGFITDGNYSFTISFLENAHTDFHVEVSPTVNFNYLEKNIDLLKFGRNRFTLFNLGASPRYVRVFCFNPHHRSQNSNTVLVNN